MLTLIVVARFILATSAGPPDSGVRPVVEYIFAQGVGNIEYASGPLSPVMPGGISGAPVTADAGTTAWYGRIMRRLPQDIPSLSTGHFIAFVSEYKDGVAVRVRCDTNANGDVSDDAVQVLYTYPGDDRARAFLVDLGRLPMDNGRERLHRIVLESASGVPHYRAQLVRTMLGTVTLAGVPHFAFLHDGNGDGLYTRDLADGLFVDLDDDGRVVVDQMSGEFGSFSVPFTMGAASYEIAAVDPEGRTISLRDLGPSPPLPAAPAVGQLAPDFHVVDTSGHALRLSDHRGRYALVYFWSSTCGKCVEQAEDLARLVERFRPKGLEILGISYDTDRRAMESFREKNHQSWPTSFSGRQLWEDPVGRVYRERGSGVLYLIDPQGNLQGTYTRLTDLTAQLEGVLDGGMASKAR